MTPSASMRQLMGCETIPDIRTRYKDLGTSRPFKNQVERDLATVLRLAGELEQVIEDQQKRIEMLLDASRGQKYK